MELTSGHIGMNVSTSPHASKNMNVKGPNQYHNSGSINVLDDDITQVRVNIVKLLVTG